MSRLKLNYISIIKLSNILLLVDVSDIECRTYEHVLHLYVHFTCIYNVCAHSTIRFLH
jgi:hypothetical protein